MRRASLLRLGRGDPPRGLRRRARRARLRHDRLSGPGPHRRHRPRARLADHHPGGALRRRDPWSRGQPAVRRHLLRPRPADLPTARPPEPRSARDVLRQVLANEGAEPSAHESLRQAHDEAEHLSTLVAEYTTLAALAEEGHWEALLERAGLEDAQREAIRSSRSERGAVLGPAGSAAPWGWTWRRRCPDSPEQGRSATRKISPLSCTVGWSGGPGRIPSGTGTPAASSRGSCHGSPAAPTPNSLVRSRSGSKRWNDAPTCWPNEPSNRVTPGTCRFGTPPADSAARAQWMRSVATVAASRELWSIEDPAAAARS